MDSVGHCIEHSIHLKSIDFLKENQSRIVSKLVWKIKYILFYVYITENDAAGHGECVKRSVVSYRLQKRPKNTQKSRTSLQ